MIAILRNFVECGIKAQIFVRVFTIFMPARHGHAHDDLVRMNFFHGAFFTCSVDVDLIADLQHLSSLCVARSQVRQVRFGIRFPSSVNNA